MRGALRVAAALGASISCAWAPRAVAQPSAAQPPAGPPSDPAERALVVVPPRLASEAVAPYPEGAHGEVVVLLTLTVNADGSVRSATPAEPNEPFSSVAVNAAQAFRFQPATRAGKPVASVIRFEVVFREPEPEAEPEPKPEAAFATAPNNPTAPSTPGSKPAPAPPPAKPVEIEVWGAKLAPAASSFTRAAFLLPLTSVDSARPSTSTRTMLLARSRLPAT